MKTCTKCGEALPLKSFPIGRGNSGGRRPQCKPCYSKYTYQIRNPEVCAQASARYNQTEKGRAVHRRSLIEHKDKRNASTRVWRERMRAEGKMFLLHQKYNYGLTPETFAALCAKFPVCAICKRNDKPLVTDHNHQTGKVRGRLCVNCNTALGKFGDSTVMLSVAMDYLEANN